MTKRREEAEAAKREKEEAEARRRREAEADRAAVARAAEATLAYEAAQEEANRLHEIAKRAKARLNGFKAEGDVAKDTAAAAAPNGA